MCRLDHRQVPATGDICNMADRRLSAKHSQDMEHWPHTQMSIFHSVRVKGARFMFLNVAPGQLMVHGVFIVRCCSLLKERELNSRFDCSDTHQPFCNGQKSDCVPFEFMVPFLGVPRRTQGLTFYLHALHLLPECLYLYCTIVYCY